MSALKYKVIKTATQYNQYCKSLEELVALKSRSRPIQDEIELLTALIEKWDQDYDTFENVDVIKMLQALMKERKIESKDLSKLLNSSSGEIADILSYKKKLSKAVIKKLSEHFKTSQKGFNRH
jgi:HTH-type transcriptional regulator/antitoxin HigA